MLFLWTIIAMRKLCYSTVIGKSRFFFFYFDPSKGASFPCQVSGTQLDDFRDALVCHIRRLDMLHQTFGFG